VRGAERGGQKVGPVMNRSLGRRKYGKRRGLGEYIIQGLLGAWRRGDRGEEGSALAVM